jgi:hypothetical protein
MGDAVTPPVAGDGGVGYSWFVIELVSEYVAPPASPLVTNGIWAPVLPIEHDATHVVETATATTPRRRLDRDGDVLLVLL